MSRHQYVNFQAENSDGEKNVQFRLTYEGSLTPTSNRNPNAAEKHSIRKKFHPQLRALWNAVPFLKEMKYPPSFPDIPMGPTGKARFGGGVEDRIDHLAKMYQRCNHNFVPLVTEDLALWCSLEILFLRPGSPGRVFEKGDIDNRLKTLLDALKMPEQMQDLGGADIHPIADEKPFYCLLENDKLVSKISVETDMLLEPIAGGIPANNDARLVIGVTLRPAIFQWGNMSFV